MKQYIIAIDGGTTNTRASLWEDPGICLDIVKSETGVRITSIEGSNASLKAAVKGLLDLFDNESGTLFALPGSHTKFVSVDAGGKMIGCLSSLAGELLSAVTLNTILASALKLLFEEDGYFEQVEIYYPSAEKPMSGYGLYQIAKANAAL